MTKHILPEAEQYTRQNRLRQIWRKFVRVMACIVVFCTTYALILPAITMEKDPACGLYAHVHSEACYTRETQQVPPPVCTYESLGVHTHTQECRGAENALQCALADFLIHEHDDSCTDDTGALACMLPEIIPHTHTDTCYEAADSGETAPVCGRDEIIPHTHSDACADDTGAVLICTQTELQAHIHADGCFLTMDTQTLTCGYEAHTHTDACYPAAAAAADTDQLRADAVISMIDKLPADTAEAPQQVQIAYYHYSNLTDKQKALVTNADRLLALESIWSVPVNYTESIPVYQINACDHATETILVHGGTVGYRTGGETDFARWTAVVMEARDDGQLYVSAVYPAGDGLDKRGCQAETLNGIVLLVCDSNAVTPAIGDPVTVDFPYRLHSGSSAEGFGAVNFGSTLKPGKDNTDDLEIIESADTLEWIEVNLFDYAGNINTLYTEDQKYPGFRQDSRDSFNFGSNITADPAAGAADLTGADGNINATAGVYNNVDYGDANIPLDGVMYHTLLDGYPALADGTSLDYLFSTGTYAARQNTANINGLFRYNADTGTYSFDSRENHAQFDSAANTFTLYRQVLSPNFMMYPFGNFLPFNDITSQSANAAAIGRSYLLRIARSASLRYHHINDPAYHTLSTGLYEFIAAMDAQYGTDWDAYDAVNACASDEAMPSLDRIYSIDYDEPTDFHFGMEMKMRFRQPGAGLNGTEPVTFRFTGDDDVWVYVDDVLFLDLSGIHHPVSGEIDFANGVIHYYAFDDAAGDTAATPYRTVTFEDAFRAAYAADASALAAALDRLNEAGTFEDGSVHSFYFYYTERGAGSGICSMDFNLPLLRQNTIAVEKQLTDDDATETVEALGDPDFTFQILSADSEETDGTSVVEKTGDSFFAQHDPVGSRWAYSLYDSDGSALQEVRVTEWNADGTIKTLTVYNARGQILRTATETAITNYPENGEVLTIDESGCFTLKAGQRAEFVGIPEHWGSYYIREVLHDFHAGQHSAFEIGSTAADPVRVTGTKSYGIDSPITDTRDGSAVFAYETRISAAALGQLNITAAVDTAGYAAPGSGDAFRFLVTLDGAPLPIGTVYTISNGTTASVAETGYIEIPAQQTAVIPNILTGTAFTVTEDSGSARGFTVTYTLMGAAENAAVAAGVIPASTDGISAAAVTVTNSVSGASVSIPGTVRCTAYGSGSHTCTIHLVQVQDQLGTALEGAAALEQTLTLDSETGTFDFQLGYAAHEFDSLPAVLYYRITETAAADAIPNDQVFIAAVTVSESGDGIQAELTNMWTNSGEDGAFVEYAAKSADFVNTLVSDLVISETVTGSVTLHAFEFQITLSEQAVFSALRDNGDGTTEALELDFTDGIEIISLTHGQTLTIADIPLGAAWTVTETNAGGFITGTVVTTDTGSASGALTATSGIIGSGTTTVAYTNTPTYVLPETGSTGTTSYTMAGLLLILCSTALLLYRSLKRRREVA